MLVHVMHKDSNGVVCDVPFAIDPRQTLGHFKGKFCESVGLDPAVARFFFDGEELEDYDEIEAGFQIDCVCHKRRVRRVLRLAAS